MAAGIHFVITLIIGDRFAKMVQEEMDLPGISIPHGSAAPALVIGWLTNKVFDLFSKSDKKEETDSKANSIANNKYVRFLSDPAIIGLILGVVLALIVKSTITGALQVGMAMAGLMYLLPRMVKVLMEGLLPLSGAAKAAMSKKICWSRILYRYGFSCMFRTSNRSFYIISINSYNIINSYDSSRKHCSSIR
jgi:Phosphotransferase system, galactitol-specific IIC component